MDNNGTTGKSSWSKSGGTPGTYCPEEKKPKQPITWKRIKNFPIKVRQEAQNHKRTWRDVLRLWECLQPQIYLLTLYPGFPLQQLKSHLKGEALPIKNTWQDSENPSAGYDSLNSIPVQVKSVDQNNLALAPDTRPRGHCLPAGETFSLRQLAYSRGKAALLRSPNSQLLLTA